MVHTEHPYNGKNLYMIMCTLNIVLKVCIYIIHGHKITYISLHYYGTAIIISNISSIKIYYFYFPGIKGAFIIYGQGGAGGFLFFAGTKQTTPPFFRGKKYATPPLFCGTKYATPPCAQDFSDTQTVI